MCGRLHVVPDSPESEESYLLEIKESAIEGESTDVTFY
jgi:hypothetical protein